MLKFYRQFILSLVITQAISIAIASGILCVAGYLYGVNSVLKTRINNGEDVIKASTYIMDHYIDLERNEFFNKRKKNDKDD